MARNTVLVRLPDGSYELMQIPQQSQPPMRRQAQQIQPRYAEYEQYPQPRYQESRPRRRRGRKKYVTGPTKALAIFLFSWGWCAIGLPGMTLATWAFGVCWLANRAFQEK